MLSRFEERMALIITATRIVISKRLKREHGMTQHQIARRLGIAQPAVSKYLSGRYSRKIASLEGYIARNRMEGRALELALRNSPRKRIAASLDSLASNRRLIRESARYL